MRHLTVVKSIATHTPWFRDTTLTFYYEECLRSGTAQDIAGLTGVEAFILLPHPSDG